MNVFSLIINCPALFFAIIHLVPALTLFCFVLAGLTAWYRTGNRAWPQELGCWIGLSYLVFHTSQCSLSRVGRHNLLPALPPGLSPKEPAGGVQEGKPVLPFLSIRCCGSTWWISPTRMGLGKHVLALQIPGGSFLTSRGLPPYPVQTCSPVLRRKHFAGEGHTLVYLCSRTAGPNR